MNNHFFPFKLPTQKIFDVHADTHTQDYAHTIAHRNGNGVCAPQFTRTHTLAADGFVLHCDAGEATMYRVYNINGYCLQTTNMD